MKVLHNRARRSVEIPTSSMADIAFLLLIFFLVTTTIDVDSGIGMVLPPPLQELPPPIHERNLLKILVNSSGDLLVDDQPIPFTSLRETVKRHVLNCSAEMHYPCSSDFAVSPDKAVVSIKTQTDTNYRTYIGVLDEVWMAYFDMWDERARAFDAADYRAYRFGLEAGAADEIRKSIPPQISIAEPDEE